ncbi:MAG TPA: sensor histidine kinase, partial [Anaerolineales bacterium]
NALRHTPRSSRISIAARADGPRLEVAIADEGLGVSAADLDRIFDRLYRTDASRRREDGGSGLGLAIARSIVLAHGGGMRADSVPGRSLTITIWLPVSTKL